MFQYFHCLALEKNYKGIIMSQLIQVTIFVLVARKLEINLYLISNSMWLLSNTLSPDAHQSLVSPCCSFFPFLSFSLSVLLSGWLLGTQELYWLSVLIKEDQASLFALLSFHLSRHPEGMRVWAMIRLACHGSSTWPCHGWDLPWWLLAMGHLILT